MKRTKDFRRHQTIKKDYWYENDKRLSSKAKHWLKSDYPTSPMYLPRKYAQRIEQAIIEEAITGEQVAPKRCHKLRDYI